jgi:hypothetical protein
LIEILVAAGGLSEITTYPGRSAAWAGAAAQLLMAPGGASANSTSTSAGG